MSLHIDGLNGPDQARLHALHLGRSHYEAFAFDAQGRTLYVWVFDDEGRQLIEHNGFSPPPPAEVADPEPPAIPKPVPIVTGARSHAPTPIPK